MVYGRRNTRKYNRRTGVYKRKGYSMYKLYKSRSSGDQARQIYGLNKKLKYIERKTRPEINIAPLVQGIIYSSQGNTLGDVSSHIHVSGPINLTNLISETQAAAGTAGYATVEGRFARLQNITMKGLFTYNIAGTTSGETVDRADLQRMIAYLRVVIIQTKATRSALAPANSDIWSSSIQGSDTTIENPTALNEYAAVRAPLQYGLSRIAKVLSDKTYMISDTKQAVNIKTKLRYVKNWYKSPSEDGPKGGVYMYVMMYDSTGDVAGDVSSSTFSYVSKCVYSDA